MKNRIQNPYGYIHVPFADEVETVDLVGSGEMLLGLVFFPDLAKSPAGDGLLSFFCLSFDSDDVFAGLEDLLGVAFLPSDPPKRSDSMSSKPCGRLMEVNFKLL